MASRQADELEVVAAMYDEGVCERSGTPGEGVSLRVELEPLRGAPLIVAFELPADYLVDSANVRPLVSVLSAELDASEMKVLNDAAQRELEAGPADDECLVGVLVAVSAASADLRENDGRRECALERGRAEAAAAAEARRSALEAPHRQIVASGPSTLARRLCHSHHIISEAKRRDIQRWADELRLSGLCKIGWPGVLIVEGELGACDEYIRRLKALNWKRFQVRGYEEEVVPDVDAARKLGEPGRMVMLPETALGELATRCRSAGVGHLFDAWKMG